MKLKNVFLALIFAVGVSVAAYVYLSSSHPSPPFKPSFRLIETETFHFNSFVDCNMAEAWIGDTFRIFPGKYGEDPLWGYSNNLKYADGKNPDEAFLTKEADFTAPKMPANVPPGSAGLHGAVWFETIYQDSVDTSGKTLFAVYHNENYPATLPYDSESGEGYIDKNWPQGITGPQSPAAVCRIGIMKSTDGGLSWENKGIFIEDKQPRMILKPHNTSKTFAGGVGDPSAVVSGAYLYLFFGEYGYPGTYNEKTFNPETEWHGQCISVARIAVADLDHPQGKAQRWDGRAFSVAYDGVGASVDSLRISHADGGGPASSPTGSFHWGPSVSWNTYLHCWVMLMARAEGPSWAGDKIYISFNPNKELGTGTNSQAWTKPKLLLQKKGYFLWYPSLQPLNTPENIANRNTCLRLGQRARLFVKNIKPEKSDYLSEYIVEFVK